MNWKAWVAAGLLFCTILLSVVTLLLVLQTREHLSRLREARDYEDFDLRVSQSLLAFFATPRNRKTMARDLLPDILSCDLTDPLEP